MSRYTCHARVSSDLRISKDSADDASTTCVNMHESRAAYDVIAVAMKVIVQVQTDSVSTKTRPRRHLCYWKDRITLWFYLNSDVGRFSISGCQIITVSPTVVSPWTDLTVGCGLIGAQISNTVGLNVSD